MESNGFDRVTYVLDAAAQGIPGSFRGVSGGPAVFGADGALIGIVNHESLEGPRRLYVAHVSQVRDLMEPFTPPPDAPTDLMGRVAGTIIPVSFNGATFHVFGIFEHYWSPSKPNHRFGLFSRLLALAIGSATDAPRLLMNVESVFFPTELNLETHVAECRSELRYILNTTKIRPLDEGPEPSELLIAQMTELISKLSRNSQISIYRSDTSGT